MDYFGMDYLGLCFHESGEIQHHLRQRKKTDPTALRRPDWHPMQSTGHSFWLFLWGTFAAQALQLFRDPFAFMTTPIELVSLVVII